MVGAGVAAVVGVLALGAPGSVAQWRAGATMSGVTAASGVMSLGPTTCAAWTFSASGGVAGSGVPSPATWSAGQVLQPGDVLDRSCTTTLRAVGTHLRGTVTSGAGAEATSPPTGVTYAAASMELCPPTEEAAACVSPVGGGIGFSAANDDWTLRLRQRVTVSADGSSVPAQGGSFALPSVVLTARQVHP